MSQTTVRPADATRWPSADLAFWTVPDATPSGPAGLAAGAGAAGIRGGASEKVSDTFSPKREKVSDTAPPQSPAGLAAGGRVLFAQVVPAFRWLPTRLFVRASELAGLPADAALQLAPAPAAPATHLKVAGEVGFLEVDTLRYRVVAKPDGSWANKHPSGILCEVQPKFAGSPHLLKRNGTLHWGPNLKRPEDHMYVTPSLGWDPPAVRVLAAGPYVCEVQLAGPFCAYRGVPAYPAIDVGLVYRFTDRGEWFGVETDVRFLADHTICLLRDDEWSFSGWPFTHIVRRTAAGAVEIDDLKERMAGDHKLGEGLRWLGFANMQTGLTMATLRLADRHAGPLSQVASFLGGGPAETANTYWNRRLIYGGGKDGMDWPDGKNGVVVPKGAVYESRFAEALIEGADEAAWARLDALRKELTPR